MLDLPRRVKILFQLLGALIVFGTPAARAQTNHFSPPLKAAQLMGVKVEDSDGQKIGAIRNLIIDTRSGQLRYAVIGAGGFLGIRSTLKLAPVRVMSAATIKRETVAINTTLDHWNRAPAFKSTQLAALGEPDRAREIAAYFDQRDIRFANPASPTLSATGGTGEQNEFQPARLKFASELMGKRVVDRQQQPIGEVLDLLVGFGQPRPAFAIISAGKFFRRGQQYAVPLTTLRHNSDGKLVLDATPADLLHAPPFDQAAWDRSSRESEPAIYTYSKPGE